MKIESITINDNDIKLANMVVIVGSNGTGKTRLIEELNYAFTNRINGNVKQYWRIDYKTEFSVADVKKWLENLTFHIETSNPIWISPFTTWNNQPDGLAISDSQYQEYVMLDESKLLKCFSPETFIKEFIHYLQVGARLGIQAQAQITPPTQKIGDILNLLFRNDRMYDEINKELKKLFKKKIVLAPHNFPNLELRIVDEDVKMPKKFNVKNTSQSFHDYIKWREQNRIGEIWTEGHGIQAFLHIMLTYCVPLNQVLLIDEPEIHLYPSVKRKFGRALGEMSNKKEK